MGRAYPYYVVACLMLASAFSFLDRLVLSLLIDPIRKAMHLSDTEVSLLAGLAFASCYVVFAFGFGRWVDACSRKGAMVVGITLWSVATALCGAARSYWQLFAARMGVGVGEASLNPAAYSMIADYFPVGRRGIAMSIFACGASLGGGLAILAGGVVVQWAFAERLHWPVLGPVEPWQFVFGAVGLPGLLVALLVALTVREPARRLPTQDSAAPPQLDQVLRFVREHWRTFLPVFLGYGAFAMNGYAFQLWGPAFFIRLHGLSPAQAGLVFGIGYGLGGTAAILLGGAISDALARRGRVEGPILAAVLELPCFLIAYLSAGTPLAIAGFAGGIFAASLVGGVQAALVQSLAPNRMRGLLAALFGATVNVAGLGLAPTLTAGLSDHVFGGPTGIGYALAATTVLAMIASIVLLMVGLPHARSLARELQDG